MQTSSPMSTKEKEQDMELVLSWFLPPSNFPWLGLYKLCVVSAPSRFPSVLQVIRGIYFSLDLENFSSRDIYTNTDWSLKRIWTNLPNKHVCEWMNQGNVWRQQSSFSTNYRTVFERGDAKQNFSSSATKQSVASRWSQNLFRIHLFSNLPGGISTIGLF